MLRATKVKMSGSEKKVNKNTYVISSMKCDRVMRNFPVTHLMCNREVSHCSRAKQRQSNVQKKCAARATLLFC